MSPFPGSPFGSEITQQEIIATMSQFHSWEDRYRQVVMWGKRLPVMSDVIKTEQITVSGCESQVWLLAQQVHDRWYFHADSDARIVRGLIAIVLAAFDGLTAPEIAQLDVDDYFAQLGLIEHLSPSRGHALKAIVEQLQAVAR